MKNDDGLRYDRMIENAMRSVVKSALSEVEAKGFPGDHHFYLTFRTTDPEVEMSAALRSQYPKEITIVLQHQFWNLEVKEDRFSVSLSFSGKPERLVVPFHSLVSFADPSAKFGLQFDVPPAALSDMSSAKPMATVPTATSAIAKPMAKGQPKEAPEESKIGSAEKNGADIVTLDAFRKK